MADPGFLVGGSSNLVRGYQLPTWLCFVKFVCQNERIVTFGGRRVRPPLDPPLDILRVWFDAVLVIYWFGINIPWNYKLWNLISTSKNLEHESVPKYHFHTLKESEGSWTDERNSTNQLPRLECWLLRACTLLCQYIIYYFFVTVGCGRYGATSLFLVLMM